MVRKASASCELSSWGAGRLQGRVTMAGYFIAKVTDAAAFEEYRREVPAVDQRREQNGYGFETRHHPREDGPHKVSLHCGRYRGSASALRTRPNSSA